jgi:TRAP-type C4-dicarboxylate transport system permease small subunit
MGRCGQQDFEVGITLPIFSFIKGARGASNPPLSKGESLSPPFCKGRPGGINIDPERMMDRFTHQLNRYGNLLERILSAFVGVALAGFAATVIVEVFCRYFLGFSLYWSNELATYLFIYLVFFGGSVALKRGELINVAFVKDRLPPKWQNGASLLVFLVMMAFSLMASAFSTVLIQTSLKTKTVSPAMLIPMSIVYLPIFVGFAFLAFFSFIGFVNAIVHGYSKER